MVEAKNFEDNIINIWVKLIAVLCFLALITATVIAWNNPAAGYELDIYTSTPLISWILIMSSFIGGISIILFQIFTKGYRNGRVWLIGLFILIISRLVLLFLPYIRGYVSWGGDNIAYLGMIKDILNNGNFTNANFYPITHVFLSSIITTTGISESIVANLSTAFITIVFILSTYLLAGKYGKRIQLLAVVIAGSVMLTNIYNVILSPNGWTFFFLPLLFYFYFSQDRMQYRILFYILLIMYPFFHPLSSLMVVLALAVFELIRFYFSKNKQFSVTAPVSLPIGICVVVEFVIFVSWVFAHRTFDANIQNLWNQIIAGQSSGKLTELGSSLDKINVHGLDFVLLLLKMFGAEIILLVLSIIGILWIFKKIRQHKREIRAQYLFMLSSILIIWGLFYAAYLLGFPGFSSLGAGQVDRRFLGYVDIFIPIFASLGMFLLLKTNKFKIFIQMGLAVLIVCASIISIVSLYFSPYIKQPNLQITSMDMAGTQWFIDRKSSQYSSVYIATNPTDLVRGIIGLEATIKRDDYISNAKLVDHFGYADFNKIGLEYIQNQYLVISTHDKVVYSTVWKEVGRYNDDDFVHLGEDASVNSLYSNGEMKIYYIRSLAN